MPLTSEQARNAQAKSAATRRNARAKAEQILALTGDQTEYLAAQLALVREHINRVLVLLSMATKPGDVERLARALNHLGERERILGGRPLPGQLRPAKEAAKAVKAAIFALPVGGAAVHKQ